MIPLGVTSMSAGSKTDPGGYASAPDSLEQFEVSDERRPIDVEAAIRSMDMTLYGKTGTRFSTETLISTKSASYIKIYGAR